MLSSAQLQQRRKQRIRTKLNKVSVGTPRLCVLCALPCFAGSREAAASSEAGQGSSPKG